MTMKRSGTSGLRFGTIRHHGGGRSAGGRNFHVAVYVERDIGASTAHAYKSYACVVRRGDGRGRPNYIKDHCGADVQGRGPTQAAKKALAALAKVLR
jgi:hypothetical protein